MCEESEKDALEFVSYNRVAQIQTSIINSTRHFYLIESLEPVHNILPAQLVQSPSTANLGVVEQEEEKIIEEEVNEKNQFQIEKTQKKNGCMINATKKLNVNSGFASENRNITHFEQNGEALSLSYSCTICNNRFKCKAKLTEHVKVIHEKLKLHECDICKKKFFSSVQVKRHLNTHTGLRPYKCKLCQAAFADPSSTSRHMRIHTNNRPFKCEVCSKSFFNSSVLKYHILRHSGEKTNLCCYCGAVFTELHHMIQHERRHQNEGSRLYKKFMKL